MNREFPGVRGRRVPGRHRTVTHAERDGPGPGPNVSIIREGYWGIHPTEIRAAFAVAHLAVPATRLESR